MLFRSAGTRDQLHAHGVKRVAQIPYGVHTRPLPSLDEKPLRAPLRLATVCRLAPNKRVDHAVRLIDRLRARQIDAQLTIVGGGEVEAQIRALVSELKLQDHITFSGQLREEEKNAVLQRAHYLVHTSMREGWGLNVIEANAMGTPGLVYPVEGLVESTLHDQIGRAHV